MGVGSVGVAGGANALVFQNATTAELGGTIKANEDVVVTADDTSKLYNIGVGVAASGSVAVGAVAVVTYFENETVARILENAVIGSLSNKVNNVVVKATSKELVTSDAAGASGSGSAAIGGTLDVLHHKTLGMIFEQKSTRTREA